jgi:glucose dehydrogenase
VTPADPSAPVDLTHSQKNETFYNRCIVEYNLNTGEFKPSKSLTANETDDTDHTKYPTLADYDAILNG